LGGNVDGWVDRGVVLGGNVDAWVDRGVVLGGNVDVDAWVDKGVVLGGNVDGWVDREVKQGEDVAGTLDRGVLVELEPTSFLMHVLKSSSAFFTAVSAFL
jgi:hypothetical protein